MTESKRWWFNVTYKETFSEINSDTIFIDEKSFSSNDDKRQFRAGVSYYF